MKLRNASPDTNGSKTAKPDPNTTLKFSADHRDHDFEYWPRPTEVELTRWAVQLARTGKTEPRQLVEKAWELYWESCRKIREDYLSVKEYFAREEREIYGADEDAYDDEKPAIPQPEAFPITFKKVQLLLLPEMEGRPAMRAARFCEYFGVQLAFQKDADQGINNILPSTNPTKNEVAREFARWRRTVFDEAEYLRFATAFLNWHYFRKAADDDFKRRVGAMVRWKKVSPEQLAELRAHGLLGNAAKAGKKLRK